MKIAIDGPAGAGKSTIAKKLAEELGYVYIDTGAMYRVLTWKALQKGIQVTCETALKQLAHSIKIHFENNSGQHKVLCNGEDLSAFIRLPQVNALVSTVASHPSIRKIMVKKQQDMANNMPVVMDGVILGNVYCPMPNINFFSLLVWRNEPEEERKSLPKTGILLITKLY
jgi:cytidylate kinase